jgi:hypothetical protein
MEAIMLLLLPYARPEHPFLKRLGIRLFNWVIWLVKALADLAEGDLGDEYARMVTLLVCLALACIITATLMVPATRLLLWWHVVLLDIALYLLFGICYWVHERSWNM